MFKWLRMSQFCFGIWWKDFVRFKVVTVSQSNYHSCCFVALVVLFRSAVLLTAPLCLSLWSFSFILSRSCLISCSEHIKLHTDYKIDSSLLFLFFGFVIIVIIIIITIIATNIYVLPLTC